MKKVFYISQWAPNTHASLNLVILCTNPALAPLGKRLGNGNNTCPAYYSFGKWFDSRKGESRNPGIQSFIPKKFLFCKDLIAEIHPVFMKAWAPIAKKRKEQQTGFRLANKQNKTKKPTAEFQLAYPIELLNLQDLLRINDTCVTSEA